MCSSFFDSVREVFIIRRHEPLLISGSMQKHRSFCSGVSDYILIFPNQYNPFIALASLAAL